MTSQLRSSLPLAAVPTFLTSSPCTNGAPATRPCLPSTFPRFRPRSASTNEMRPHCAPTNEVQRSRYTMETQPTRDAILDDNSCRDNSANLNYFNAQSSCSNEIILNNDSCATALPTADANQNLFDSDDIQSFLF